VHHPIIARVFLHDSKTRRNKSNLKDFTQMKLQRLKLRMAPLCAAICVTLLLAACDEQRAAKLEEGVSTEAQVLLEFGQPENIWDGENGSRVLEFNRQPAGHTNYMVTIDANGVMSSLQQVLAPHQFAKVQPGMLMEDVRKLLGKPARITPYALQKTTHYDWYWRDGQTDKVFTVVFDNDLRVQSSGSSDKPSDGQQH
jgi:SmpA / OmlA family